MVSLDTGLKKSLENANKITQIFEDCIFYNFAYIFSSTLRDGYLGSQFILLMSVTT